MWLVYATTCMQSPGGEQNMNDQSPCPQEAYTLTEEIERWTSYKIRQNKMWIKDNVKKYTVSSRRKNPFKSEVIQDGSRKKCDTQERS